MASHATVPEHAADASHARAAMQHRPWRSLIGLSSIVERFEHFLAGAGFDRAPWLAVAFAGGIAAWFGLDNRWHWLALVAACLALSLGTAAALRAEGRLPFLRQALVAMPLLVAAGCLVVWTKSAQVGMPAIARPVVAEIRGRVLEREEQPAEGRVRLLLAAREPGGVRAIRVRINLPVALDRPDIAEGAVIGLRARLMPPAPPMLPGSYDFARAAWFAGIAATGSALGEVTVLQPSGRVGWLARLKAGLSRHVRAQLPGTAGSIAAAYASGDRGAIAAADDDAMRDAGLTHLLSISGLHVSAVIGAAYLLALRLLALWPWLALRVRLPLVAAAGGALAGIGYTLLTGAEVPTVRSCIGALLVLAALALGREALSLRMVAVAAFVVLLFWPEAIVGPSFQMSFAAVIAIVALSGSAPVRGFLAPREEGLAMRGLRALAMLLATGVVIELALMPIGLFHFHRAGVYGALANVVAIPLTTVVTMPLIALALLLDLVGAGHPAWWAAGKSIDLMLALAHWVARQPGAVTTMPAMGLGSIALFVAGGLWLALWQGRVRHWGLLPIAAGIASLALLQPPDILVSGDGRQVALTGEGGGELLVLRDSRSPFVRDNLTEMAGKAGEPRLLSDWPGARCSADFCVLRLHRGGRDWQVLLTRSRDRVPERELAAACDRVDIVIADRRLSPACRPRVLKADRRFLDRNGGLAIALDPWRVRTVAATQGEHGWWRAVSHVAPAKAGTAGGRAGRSVDEASGPGSSPGRR